MSGVMLQTVLIIQCSKPNSDSEIDRQWKSLQNHEVPDWVKHPNQINLLRKGQQLEFESNKELYLYRAIKPRLNKQQGCRIAEDYLSEHIDLLKSNDSGLVKQLWEREIKTQLNDREFIRYAIQEAQKNPDAFQSLFEVADELQTKGVELNPALADWLSLYKTKHIKKPHKPGNHPTKFLGRDLVICWTVYLLEQSGWKPTSNKHDCGCSIVSEALSKLGIYLSYEAVKSIWQKYKGTKSG